MPTVIETTVFLFEELGEAAKRSARDWYREHALDPDWHEVVFEDFERVCGILGIELKTRPVRLFGGGLRQKPCIWFSGFASQGDGACFEGHYAYARGAARSMRGYAPKDAELHAIADRLQRFQRTCFYQISAAISHSGRYYHAQSMMIDVEREGECVPVTIKTGVEDALRDLAHWLYRQLEREYDYLISDEVLDESIIANGYSFTEVGRRFG